MSEEKNNKNADKKTWRGADETLMREIQEFSKGYMNFLDEAKTEREAVREVIRLGKLQGFSDISNFEKLKPGDRVYSVNHKKSVYLAVIGEDALTDGFNAVGAHIDAPRLDLKQNPLYEDSDIALLKTHYYGGIKKYQWTAIPLALHGVIALTDGSVQDVCIGENADDPIFLVTDLLPHLSAKQNAKKLAEGVPAENLNIVFGSLPNAEAESESVKANILGLLEKKYGMKETDFRSAEIEAVPAGRARSLGLDSSMVAAYGQDDRVCAYPSMMALFDVKTPKRTAVCILSDKEEIGSVGNTGMESQNFELFLMDMLEKTGIISPYAVQRTLSASSALSADVTAAYDPTYADVMEKNNAAYMGRGISIKKYTGSRGKAGSFRCKCRVCCLCERNFRKCRSKLSVFRNG